MAVAKRQSKERAHKNRTKEGPQTGEPQVKQTAPLASPVYTGQTQREEKNRSQN